MALYAKVNTKSNFKNANGRWLRVDLCIGTLISAFVPAGTFDDGGEPTGQPVKADFSISDIVELRHSGGDRAADNDRHVKNPYPI